MQYRHNSNETSNGKKRRQSRSENPMLHYKFHGQVSDHRFRKISYFAHLSRRSSGYSGSVMVQKIAVRSRARVCASPCDDWKILFVILAVRRYMSRIGEGQGSESIGKGWAPHFLSCSQDTVGLSHPLPLRLLGYKKPLPFLKISQILNSKLVYLKNCSVICNQISYESL